VYYAEDTMQFVEDKVVEIARQFHMPTSTVLDIIIRSEHGPYETIDAIETVGPYPDLIQEYLSFEDIDLDVAI